MSQAIKVCVRFRGNQTVAPSSSGQSDFLHIQFLKNDSQTQTQSTISLNQRNFSYDHVLDSSYSQQGTYKALAQQTVASFMAGYNSTIFAYGQSGSGKTYTMLGPDQVVDVIRNGLDTVPPQIQELYGVIPRATLQIFQKINQLTLKQNAQVTIKVFYFQVYNQALNNILTTPIQQNLKMRETPDGGISVLGAQPEYVTSPEEIFEMLQIGTMNRAVTGTNQNARSSRSHTLFVLDIQQKFADGSFKQSRLNLVDLAGSERIAKTGASGQTLQEAKKINQSLSCLGNCILALTSTPKKGSKGKHIPFRDSKLTFFLKESLGGNAKTALVCTASKQNRHLEETIQTLRFAQRAKKIKNKAKSNVVRSPKELQEIINKMKIEINGLKKQLQEAGIAINVGKGEIGQNLEDNKQKNIDDDALPTASAGEMSTSYAQLKSRFEKLKQSSDLRIAILSQQLLVAKQKAQRRDEKRLSKKKFFQEDQISTTTSHSKKSVVSKNEENQQIKTDSQSDYEEQISQLKANLDQKTLELQDSLNLIKSTNVKLHQIEIISKQSQKNFVKQISDLTVKVQALEKSNSINQQTINDYQAKYQSAIKGSSNQNSVNQQLKEKISKMDLELKDKNSICITKDAQLELIKEQNKTNKLLSDENKKKLIAQKLHITVLQAETKRLKNQKGEILSKTQELRAEIEKLKKEQNDFSAKHQSSMNERDKLSQKQNLLQNQLKAMQIAYQKQIADLTAKLDVKELQILKKESVAKENQAKLLVQNYTKKLQKSLEDNLNLSIKLKETEQKMAGEIEEMKKIFSLKEQQLENKIINEAKNLKENEIQKPLKQKEKIIIELQNSNKKSLESLDQLQKEKDATQNRFKQNIEAAKEQFKELETKFSESKQQQIKQMTQLNKQIHEKASEIQEYKKRIIIKEQEEIETKKQGKNKLIQLEKSLNAQKLKVQQKSNQIRTFKQEITKLTNKLADIETVSILKRIALLGFQEDLVQNPDRIEEASQLIVQKDINETKRHED